jgi:tyrosyl-tRNA synthetase
LAEATESDPGRQTAQNRLAEWLTGLVHGDEGLEAAKRASKILFGDEIGKQTDASLGEIFSDVPSRDVPRNKLHGEGYWIVEALQDAGLVSSGGEARRAIKDGGAYVNNVRVTDMNHRLSEADLASETVMVLRKGKRNYALLRFSQ